MQLIAEQLSPGNSTTVAVSLSNPKLMIMKDEICLTFRAIEVGMTLSTPKLIHNLLSLFYTTCSDAVILATHFSLVSTPR